MKIAILGAGNVATHLGLALKKSGHEIVQVYSRSETSAKALAGKLKCRHVTEIKSITQTAALYIVSISDHAVKGLLKSVPLKDQLIIHTSGALPLTVFGNKFKNCGVIYPLQTFSKNRKIKFNDVPLLVEANHSASLAKITQVASGVSKFVFELPSSDRKFVHLAAVFANNFSNHLFVQAEKILNRKNIPFPLLGPLMHETVIKAIKLGPGNAQTGPAKRGDSEIMEAHLAMLKSDPALRQMYKLMSESIEQSGAPLL